MRTRVPIILVLAVVAVLAPPTLTRPAHANPSTAYERVTGLREVAGPQIAAAATDPHGDHGLTDDHDEAVRRLSAPTTTPIPFSTVGFSEPVRFRTSEDGRTWTPWHDAPAVDGAPDGPEADGAERHGPDAATEPVWVGDARHIQVETSDGTAPAEIEIHLIDAKGRSRSLTERVGDTVRAAFTPPPAVAAEGVPYISRVEWGADESLRNGKPRYADDVRFGAIHHTVSANDYRRDEVKAMVRGMYRYHTQALGWDDIGYNALVDRFGRIYEGRAGGLDRGVIGAHSGGFNTGSFGLSVIGTFTEKHASSDALNAAADFVGWKFKIHGIDKNARIKVVSGGSNKHAAGKTIAIDTLVGHRDLVATACPGDRLYELVHSIRAAATFDGPAGNDTPPAAPAPTEPTPTEQPTAAKPPTDEPAPEIPRASFRDIDESPHAVNIKTLQRTGVTTGCTDDRYCPDDGVTRGQMASFLVRAFDIEPARDIEFRDVPEDSPHAAAIGGIVASRIATGYGDGTFRPNERLSRAHMAVFLHRVLDMERVWGFPFDDLPRDDVNVRPRVNALAEAGITSGCTEDLYCPAAAVTRAQMATFLVRSMEYAED